MLTLRCQTIEWPELLVLSVFYTIGLRGGARDPPGVDYKSTRAQLSVSLFRPRELLATSYGLFPKETSNLHISGTPYRTASWLRMEVHMGKRYRLIGIGRYQHLRETLRFHNSKTVRATELKFCMKFCILYFVFCIRLVTIANDEENPDPRQVVYTDFKLRDLISRKRFELRSWNFVWIEIWHRAILKPQHFEAGTQFVFQLGNPKAPKRLEPELQNFMWK